MLTLSKGLNPLIINCYGKNQVDWYPGSFKSKEAQQLLKQFPRAIHFAVDEIPCKESCPPECPSKFQRLYFKNGEFIEMTDQNRIGSGGFGMVYRGLFHGEEMAMKFTLVKVEIYDRFREDFEKKISELIIQKKVGTAESGIIVPVAFVRQQNQEQDQNGKWIAKNYNVYVYPLYDGNLNELHKNYFDVFTEEILADIIAQCLKRKSSIAGKNTGGKLFC